MTSLFHTYLGIEKREDLSLGNLKFYEEEGLLDLSEKAKVFLSKIETLKKGRQFCKRSDFNPADFKAELSGIVLMDVFYNNAGSFKDAKIRLLGSSISEFYGEYGGHSLLEVTPVETRERTIIALNKVLETRNIVGMSVEQNDIKKPYFHSEAVFSPLSEDGDVINKILGFINISTKRPTSPNT